MRALALLGYEEHEVLGAPIYQILQYNDGLEDDGGNLDNLARIVSKGYVSNVETTYRAKNGDHDTRHFLCFRHARLEKHGPRDCLCSP